MREFRLPKCKLVPWICYELSRLTHERATIARSTTVHGERWKVNIFCLLLSLIKTLKLFNGFLNKNVLSFDFSYQEQILIYLFQHCKSLWCLWVLVSAYFCLFLSKKRLHLNELLKKNLSSAFKILTCTKWWYKVTA